MCVRGVNKRSVKLGKGVELCPPLCWMDEEEERKSEGGVTERGHGVSMSAEVTDRRQEGYRAGVSEKM